MMMFQGRVLRTLLAIPLFFLTMVLVHELGHAATAAYLTPAEVRLYIWPGYELHPDWGREFPEAWPDRTPAMTYLTFGSGEPGSMNSVPGFINPGTDAGLEIMKQLDESKKQEHAVRLMGSTTTLLVALVSLLLISVLKPRGYILWILAAGACLHVDILAGTVFPIFFNARHLYFWGSVAPEAVEALSGMGFPEGFSIAAIILLSPMQCLWLCYLLAFKLRDNTCKSSTAPSRSVVGRHSSPG